MTIDELEAAYDHLMEALNIAIGAKAQFLAYLITMAVLQIHAGVQEAIAAG